MFGFYMYLLVCTDDVFSFCRFLQLLYCLDVCIVSGQLALMLACLLVVVRRYRRRRCTVESGRSVVSTHMASKSKV